MRRRDFLLAATLLLPKAQQTLAQPAPRRKRLVIIVIQPIIDPKRDQNVIVFFDEMRRLGYVDGENVDVSYVQFQPHRLSELATEIIDTNPDVIVSPGSPMTLTLKKATRTIPVVAITGDPVAFGIVTNLARPGGNVTGVSVDAGLDVWAKRLEFLSLTVPKMKSALFVSTTDAWWGAGGQAVREAARKLDISIVHCRLGSPYGETEFREAFASIQRDQVEGVILSDEGNVHRPKTELLVQLIRQLGLPTIYPYKQFVDAGGLMAYASDFDDVLRGVVGQVVKIFRGTNPGDIPYYQAAKFELAVNLKAAKELGLEMPPGLVAGASSIIE